MPAAIVRSLAMALLAGSVLGSGAGSAVASRTAASTAAEGSPRALIDQVIEAYGGRQALEKVKSYRVEGRIVAVMQKREGPTTRLLLRPDRLRIEIHYPDDTETRILRGAQGWRSAGGPLEPASGPMLEAMMLQAARASVPWILMERAAEAHSIEPMDVRGRELLGLEITLAEGLTLRVYVDPATYRVELSRGMLEHGPMHTAFETIYEDFRMVDGVLFAFREENYASGTRTGYTAIESVQWNPKLHAEDFLPPSKRRT